MCGIAGCFAFGPDAAPVDKTVISQLNDLMSRRGPDGAGLWASADGAVVLGHRRLAIIDIGTSGSASERDTAVSHAADSISVSRAGSTADGSD